MDDSDGAHPAPDAGRRPVEVDDQEETPSDQSGGEPSASSPAADETPAGGEDGWHPV